MANIGDSVRFLNTTGGGVITRIEGKTAFVEEDSGFESPVLLKDIVVVLPAGHQPDVKGSKIMFDQKAFDEGRKSEPKVTSSGKPDKESVSAGTLPENTMPVEETPHGDSPNIILAFEPHNIRNLSSTKFTGVLVNDSNYFLDFIFLRRASDDRGWQLIYKGTVSPNELLDVLVVSYEELPELEKVTLQAVAYKMDKAFSKLPPINVSRKIDLTKFHKLHCFHPSNYFDGNVLEFQLVKEGSLVEQVIPDAKEIEEALKKSPDKQLAKELAKKYNDSPEKRKERADAMNPHKKLPLIEVDLHIGELTETLAGMEPKDMLEMQLDEVRKTMKAHASRIGQKIVFIHGKGEGVLRKAVLEFLRKNYPKAELQDASFREYGFGATLVTIH